MRKRKIDERAIVGVVKRKPKAPKVRRRVRPWPRIASYRLPILGGDHAD
jgi:hypothetical protein